MANEWISVSERLPEEGQLVLVVYNGITQHALYRLREDGCWDAHDIDCDIAPGGTFSH